MKKIIAFIVSGAIVAALCAAQTPLPENGGFHQEGIASWYGPEFQGRPTASGELFDPNQFTAAHPNLPFGTIVTVTNMINGKQVQVKINDRGPFTRSRIIDVSKAAAERLDMLDAGIAQVSIEIAPRGTVPPAAAPASRQVAPTSGLNSSASSATSNSYYTQTSPQNDPSVQNVQIGTGQPAQTRPTQTQDNTPIQSDRLPSPTFIAASPSQNNQQAQSRQTAATPTNTPYQTNAPSPTQPSQNNQRQTTTTPTNTPYPTQPSQNNQRQTTATPTTAPYQTAQPTQAQGQPLTTQTLRQQPTTPYSTQPQQNSPPQIRRPTAAQQNDQQSRLPTPTQPMLVPETTRTTNAPEVVTQPRVPPATSTPTASRNTTAPTTVPPIPQTTAPRIPASQPITTRVTTPPDETRAASTTRAPTNPVPSTTAAPATPPLQNAPIQPVASTMRPPTPTPPINSYQQAQTLPAGQTPIYRPVETYTTAELKGDPIEPGKSYRLQVGSYRVPSNASEAMDRLTRMGINAQYEPYSGMYRIVVSNVRAEDVPSMAIKIGNAGFREAVARTER